MMQLAIPALKDGRCSEMMQREAAKVPGLKSGVAVSCQLRNSPELLAAGDELKKVVDHLDRELAAKSANLYILRAGLEQIQKI
ncbi:MAG: hypothetical protein WCN95_04280 [bacterium]